MRISVVYGVDDRRWIRAGCWIGLLLLLGVDAVIASSISLGVLYFVPLSIGALNLHRFEALLLALACTVGRILFGPGTDPLGLEGVTIHLAPEIATVINALFSALGYGLVALVLARLRSQQRRIRRLGHEVETDPLTGLGNRRALGRAMQMLAERGEGAAVLCLDLDHFKRINDTLGHEAGDDVLRELAERLQAEVRGRDLVARAGGEEFVVLLPGADRHAALGVAERIRAAVADRAFLLPSGPLWITISIGCATGSPEATLLARADEALYAAKHAGRNRVSLAA